MRNFKQMTAIGLSVLSIAQCFSPVFAEGEVTNTISEAGSLSSDVTYTQDSSFTVSIPKKIILDSNKSAAYHVNVTGDIYGDQTITVTPDTEITLTDKNGKGTVTATVAQDDNVFECADIKAVSESGEMVGKTVEGSITAEGLTAGEWEGTLNYNVALENIGNETPVALAAGLYDVNDVMLCSWEDSGIDVETDYTFSNYKTATTSPYYVLTNNYPTATKVVVPDGVTSIGNYTFFGCSNLTSITIPDSVTSIGEYAFDHCSNLTSINVDSNNSSYSSADGILFNKDKTTLIHCPGGKSENITIPNSVTSIGNNTFDSCSNLTSITIPNSVTSIGNYAFFNCSNLTSITIPSSVTSIGNYAFYDCSNLTNVTFENPTGWYVGNVAGLGQSKLANTSTAATYLTDTYSHLHWTR